MLPLNPVPLCPHALPRSLAARWNMPVELAIDLAALALYDVVIYADDSGSMAFEEDGSRIDDLKLVLSRTAEVRRAERLALGSNHMPRVAGSSCRPSGDGILLLLWPLQLVLSRLRGCCCALGSCRA